MSACESPKTAVDVSSSREGREEELEGNSNRAKKITDLRTCQECKSENNTPLKWITLIHLNNVSKKLKKNKMTLGNGNMTSIRQKITLIVLKISTIQVDR